MNNSVIIVRIYLSEADIDLHELLSLLHDELQVHGVTVFRGISGFGSSGKIHGASLIDAAFDLPIVVEFHETQQQAQTAMKKIQEQFSPSHIVYWNAQTWETSHA